MKSLSEVWIQTENSHRVSKEAADAFFDVGQKWFHQVFEAKAREGITSKTPRFTHIRRCLINKNVPPIHMEVGFKNKNTGEVTVVKEESIPRSRFPPQEYEKTYEIASVKVCFILVFFFSASFPPFLIFFFPVMNSLRFILLK